MFFLLIFSGYVDENCTGDLSNEKKTVVLSSSRENVMLNNGKSSFFKCNKYYVLLIYLYR